MPASFASCHHVRNIEGQVKCGQMNFGPISQDKFKDGQGLDKVSLGVSKNRSTPKSSILIGFSIIFTIHFGVPLFLETPI